MEESEIMLSSRLISLLKNGQWGKYDVVKLFKALLEQYNGRNEPFDTWMMKILHQVEIHKISVSDLTTNDSKIVNNIEAKINEIKNTDKIGKRVNDVVEEIQKQGNINKKLMAKVQDIVTSVSICLSYSTAPHLTGIEELLFKICRAVQKKSKNKITPRVTQMVCWCILVLSESSRLVQVLTGEGKSCIVAMFAAYQVLMGKKKPDIISSSPILAERDAKEWTPFYNELCITVDVNTNKSEEKELKKCYEHQVVYGTAVSFAADFLRQRVLRQDVRPKREFQCVIVDEVDSSMLDKSHEVVYLSSEIPLMESLNGILAKIWFVVSQLKRLETGEILGPIQLFSEVLSQILQENKDLDQPNVMQIAMDAVIMPSKLSMEIQENMKNAPKELDKTSVVQIVRFITMFVQNYPEYFFKLHQEGHDGNVQKLNEIGSTSKNTSKEISLLLIGCGKCRVVYYEEDSLVKSLSKMIKKEFCTNPNDLMKI